MALGQVQQITAAGEIVTPTTSTKSAVSNFFSGLWSAVKEPLMGAVQVGVQTQVSKWQAKSTGAAAPAPAPAAPAVTPTVLVLGSLGVLGVALVIAGRK